MSSGLDYLEWTWDTHGMMPLNADYTCLVCGSLRLPDQLESYGEVTISGGGLKDVAFTTYRCISTTVTRDVAAMRAWVAGNAS